MEPCELLTWDTEFFNHRIARVLAQRLNPSLVQEILQWCKIHEIECLYFLADSDHRETVALAEEHGFNFVDIRVTLQCKIREQWSRGPNKQDQTVLIRPLCPEDILALQAIAKSSYTLSRYYFDSHFLIHSCEAFYETWIKNSCQGYADMVFTAEKDNEPIGFITCHLIKASSEGKIGLIGVKSQARGYGVGYGLINHALHWFAGQGVDMLRVVTQGRNIQALRLYQQFNFVPESVKLWYHKWMVLK